jgi:hypothetical protein
MNARLLLDAKSKKSKKFSYIKENYPPWSRNGSDKACLVSFQKIQQASSFPLSKSMFVVNIAFSESNNSADFLSSVPDQ